MKALIMCYMIKALLAQDIKINLYYKDINTKDFVVLQGPNNMILDIISNLPTIWKFEVSKPVQSQTSTKIISGTKIFQLQSIPVSYMQLKGYISHTFGLGNIFYKNEQGQQILINDPISYQKAVKSMMPNLQFYIEPNSEQNQIPQINQNQQETLLEYYEKHSKSMSSLVKAKYDIVLNQTEFAIQSISLPLLLSSENETMHIINLIPHLNQLQHLDLIGNLISEQGCSRLASAISSLPLKFLSLAFMNLQWNHLKRFYESLSDPPKQLQTLQLSLNTIGLIQAKYLNKILNSFPSLKNLIMRRNIQDPQILNQLQSLQLLFLQKLDFGFNTLGISGTQSLSSLINCHNTIQLVLQNCQIGQGMKHLVQLLHSCYTLQSLFLAQNQLTDEDIEIFVTVFPSLKNLKVLDLRNNLITSLSVKTLRKNLPSLEALQSLNLAYNDLSPIDQHLLQQERYPFYSLSIQLQQMKGKILIPTKPKIFKKQKKPTNLMPSIVGRRQKLHSVSPKARNDVRKYLKSICPSPNMMQRTDSENQQEGDCIQQLPPPVRKAVFSVEFPMNNQTHSNKMKQLEELDLELFPKDLNGIQTPLPQFPTVYTPEFLENQTPISILRNRKRRSTPEQFKIRNVIGTFKNTENYLNIRNIKRNRFLNHIEASAFGGKNNSVGHSESRALRQFNCLRLKMKKFRPSSLLERPIVDN